MDLREAIESISTSAERLRRVLRFDWPAQAEQAVCALHFLDAAPIAVAAIVGGASSGKSTVFNNLLGGRLASRVTARGHSTKGLIAAVHEAYRDSVDRWLAAGLLMPSFAPQAAALDDNAVGEPGALTVVYHGIDALRDVILVDTPDFTSEPARLEGDIALATLPWYDQLVVVIDHERWFDRQSIGRLRQQSEQFGQSRFVLFNRNAAGPMPDDQHARLVHQGERLGASGHLVLEFRQGRGCVLFPPGTFDPLLAALHAPAARREPVLLRFVSRAAVHVLNSNAERRAKLLQLDTAVRRARESALPSAADCLKALMTTDERRHLDIIERTLRLREGREWLSRQADRVRQAVRARVPVLGSLIAGQPRAELDPSESGEEMDRQTLGWRFHSARCRRAASAIEAAAAGSEFWFEVRRWTNAGAPPLSTRTIEERRGDVTAIVGQLDQAIKAWVAKVQAECTGASPWVVGAVGATALAAAVVLIAVSGPIAALTLPAAKLALANAIGAIAASAGAGALAGKPLGRVVTMIYERLVGSLEFSAVRESIEGYRRAIASCGRALSDEALSHAQALVIDEDDRLTETLTTLADAEENA